MQAVGKIGSYIGRSVYTVSGPFHPFGGAVDIIVVEQPDGSYKSSPWYVRFGKFQGVLKTKEKVVSICVNGVEADFYMYLDHKGEAFFLKEVDLEGESACSPPSSSDDSALSDSKGNERNAIAAAVSRTNSRRPQILGLVFGKKSSKGETVQDEDNASDIVRADSLERAEIAADLLDLNWSTNLTSSRVKEVNAKQFSAVDISKDEVNKSLQADGCGHDETGPISDNSYNKLQSTVEENGVEAKCLNSDYIVETPTSVESVSRHADLSYSETVMTDDLGSGKSDFRVSSVSLVSEVSKSDTQIQDSVGNFNNFSDTKFPEKENSGDAIQSFCCSEASENSGFVLVQSTEHRNNSCHGGYEEACVNAETVHSMSLKYEPRRGMAHAKEPLGIQQECLREEDQLGLIHEQKASLTGVSMCGASESIVTECFSQIVSLHQSNDSHEAVNSWGSARTSASSHSICLPVKEQSVLRCTHQAPGILQEEQVLCVNLDDFGSTDAKHLEFSSADHEGGEADSSFSSIAADGVNQSSEARCYSVYSLDQSVIDGYINDGNPPRRKLISISSDVCINKTGHAQSKELRRMVRSLPTRGTLSDNLADSDLGHFSNPSVYPDVEACGKNNHQSFGVQTVDEDAKILKESSKGYSNPLLGNSPFRSVDSLGGTRRGWPFSFKRSRSVRVSHVDMKGSGNPREVKIINNSSELERGKNAAKLKANKKILRALTPTSEQLASLNLKEGKNIVVFTFSTAMLGKQQVDARIFLWRWDTRIVISDVDGTITRSDLLGQVMPWVGMDWSQTGVAHLFSAIKENGYQLLFLSARSISQSFYTRQFLFNIRQDGKTLPDGPVVISPDGLFPSLFREVVRRTPHEFKITCLENIKALFPADTNPFYAGFGNRDTDEFSYLKVGIPRGKIFTINPKGEIVVNRHVHRKSYLSLHALVHGMFPSMSSFEQEDFNSWNYWKLPPPVINI